MTDLKAIADIVAASKTNDAHLNAEAAIVHGDWPFVCPYCTTTFQTNDGHYPYCGAQCAINAEQS